MGHCTLVDSGDLAQSWPDACILALGELKHEFRLHVASKKIRSSGPSRLQIVHVWDVLFGSSHFGSRFSLESFLDCSFVTMGDATSQMDFRRGSLPSVVATVLARSTSTISAMTSFSTQRVSRRPSGSRSEEGRREGLWSNQGCWQRFPPAGARGVRCFRRSLGCGLHRTFFRGEMHEAVAVRLRSFPAVWAGRAEHGLGCEFVTAVETGCCWKQESSVPHCLRLIVR